MTMGTYEELRESDDPCPLCPAAARAAVLVERGASESNMKMKAFIEGLAATPISMHDCTEVILRIWGYQIDQTIDPQMRRRYVLRHLNFCGHDTWALRLHIRTLRHMCVTMLMNIDHTENIKLYVPKFLQHIESAAQLWNLLRAHIAPASLWPPTKKQFTVATDAFCVFCHSTELESYDRIIHNAFDMFCLEGAASIGALVAEMTTLFTPAVCERTGVHIDEVSDHVTQHLFYHDNSFYSVFFVLRCIVSQFNARMFEITFSLDQQGPSATDPQLLKTVTFANGRLAKIKAEIKKQGEGRQCFGMARPSGICFTRRTPNTGPTPPPRPAT